MYRATLCLQTDSHPRTHHWKQRHNKTSSQQEVLFNCCWKGKDAPVQDVSCYKEQEKVGHDKAREDFCD